MRILLLTQWFTPEPAIAYQELAEELTALGHDVTVVTGFPNWPQGKIYDGYKVKLWQRETINGIKVLRLPLYPDHGLSKMKRVMNLSSLAFFFALLGPLLVKRPHRMHVVQLPTLGYAARWAGFWWRTPFTFEVQDMWPETLAATGMITSSKLLNLIGKICKKVYKKAARIRVISPGFKQNLIEKGVPAEKIEVITNWADPEVYKPVSRDEALAEKLGMAGKFNVLYAGTMGLAQNLSTALAAAKLLEDIPDIQFNFAGHGVDEEALREEAKDLKNVRFLGSFSHNEIIQVYGVSDALLMHLKNDPLFKITIPGKTLSYLAVGRPIIAALKGDAANVIVNAGAGVACAPQDPEELAKAVRELYEMTPDQRAEMGRKGREASLELYSKGPLSKRMEEMIVNS